MGHTLRQWSVPHNLTLRTSRAGRILNTKSPNFVQAEERMPKISALGGRHGRFPARKVLRFFIIDICAAMDRSRYSVSSSKLYRETSLRRRHFKTVAEMMTARSDTRQHERDRRLSLQTRGA